MTTQAKPGRTGKVKLPFYGGETGLPRAYVEMGARVALAMRDEIPENLQPSPGRDLISACRILLAEVISDEERGSENPWWYSVESFPLNDGLLPEYGEYCSKNRYKGYLLVRYATEAHLAVGPLDWANYGRIKRDQHDYPAVGDYAVLEPDGRVHWLQDPAGADGGCLTFQAGAGERAKAGSKTAA